MRSHAALSGGHPATITICGATHQARLAVPGDRMVARARRGSSSSRAYLVLDRCGAGRWTTLRRLKRRSVTFAAPGDGDYRVRLLGAKGARSAYLRSGVGEIVSAPFAVAVRNRNTSLARCFPIVPDGSARVIRGHLTGPRTALAGTRPSATLLLHGLSYGEFFWRFGAVAGYDTTHELARAGHVSVAVDRLGYGASRGPGGAAICLGAQADIAAQITAALKRGAYELTAERPVAFSRVALIGHSIGGLVAELAAASFDGIDALGILSYADLGASPLAVTTVGAASTTCLAGGDPAEPGFAYFGATPAEFRAAHLNAPTDPDVADAASTMRPRDPCGDLLTITPALVGGQLASGSVHGPVLVLAGIQDALFPPPAAELQAARMMAAGATVTEKVIPGTGHAITLGRSAPAVRAELSSWLASNGF